MGFLKKLGKGLKKGIKKYGKTVAKGLGSLAPILDKVPIIGSAASAAIHVNQSFLTGHVSKGVKQLGSEGVSGVLDFGVGALTQGVGGGGFLSALGGGGGGFLDSIFGGGAKAQQAGEPIGGTLDSFLQSGKETLACQLLGVCPPAAPKPGVPSGGFALQSGAGASEAPNASLLKFAAFGGLALLAWIAFRK
jgi:hypothetical protein